MISISPIASAVDLARAGMAVGLAVGLAGLLLEEHPNADQVKWDGPGALPLDKLEAFLAQVKAVDDLVKSSAPLEIC